MNGYAAKVPFYNANDLTMREVQNVFQLDPEPLQMELNDYIREAVRHKDLAYFSFFLHHFEKRLNGVIYRFLTRNGYDRYDPARFLDYKLEVLQMLLYCLPKFDPEQETNFLKTAILQRAMVSGKAERNLHDLRARPPFVHAVYL